jgi:hypothetical protein
VGRAVPVTLLAGFRHSIRRDCSAEQSAICKSLVDKTAGEPQIAGDLTYSAGLSAKLAYSGRIDGYA